ncbi:hypothetical protein LSM04_004212 [Trypanosoma melophagium]|uniref:uncharacterized protein n=1 Tax=Trypanosoma melophagium TaxID=715481 RepID=UPI00351A3BDC|nr:hypothetical protein LSM04_004212 [Trypanosoma melophagium]
MGGKVTKQKFQTNLTGSLGNGYQQEQQQQRQQQQKLERKRGPMNRNTVSDGNADPTNSPSYSSPITEKGGGIWGKSIGGVSTVGAPSALQKEERWATVTPAAAAVREASGKVNLNVDCDLTPYTDTNEARLGATNNSGSPKMSYRRVAFLPNECEDTVRSPRSYTRKTSNKSFDGDVVIFKRVPHAILSLATVGANIDENGYHSAGLGDTFGEDDDFLDDNDSVEQNKADSDDVEPGNSICKPFSVTNRDSVAGRASVVTSAFTNSGVATGDGTAGAVNGANGSQTDKKSRSKSKDGRSYTGRYITSAKLNHARLIGSMTTHQWIHQWLREIVMPEEPDLLRGL